MTDTNTNPRRTCDIVMKGGITSGVVYPKAVSKLAERFTFRNIGGTSAGAIAAAVAAAAEYRRVRDGSDAGFMKIEVLGSELASQLPGSSQTKLFSLFAPNRETKKLFQVLTCFLGERSLVAKIVLTLLRAVIAFPLAAFLGLTPGLALALFSLSWSPSSPLPWLWIGVGGLIAIVGGFLGASAHLAFDFVTKIPANKFGLCNGMTDNANGKNGPEPLTAWLSSYIDEVAGNESNRPLIFNDLWNPTGNSLQYRKEVNLEMMTTNLTHGRPYRLPFRDDDDLKENHLFYFCKKEFESLFPKEVVDWMISKPRKPKSNNEEQKQLRTEREAKGYHPLPDPGNLPVIVATRMSLSFPVLLSVIPLYAIDYTKKQPYQELERCWFTDGGVCSNFPIHFFDGPLPRRPTFSIDLTNKPDDTPNNDLEPDMDQSNRFSPMDRWNRFDLKVSVDPTKTKEKGNFGKLTGFAGALISTMQNWNDATQSRLPGYRDRIVRIPLTSRQGGLNLNMPPELVTFLTGQGDKCANQLISHFDVQTIGHDLTADGMDVPTDEIVESATQKRMTWNNHRWVRLRSMFASFEKMVNDTLTACDVPENGDPSYEDLLHYLKANRKEMRSYVASDEQIDAALDTIAAMRELKKLWVDAGGAAEKSPRPRPLLRPRPQI